MCYAADLGETSRSLCVCVCVLQVSDTLIYANYVTSYEQFVHYL